MQDGIKFLHYRALNEEDDSVLPNEGATVAYSTGENGTSYAIAWCSPLDNYNKAYGRAKSAGRMLSPDFALTTVDTNSPSFIEFMDGRMSSNHGLYRR